MGELRAGFMVKEDIKEVVTLHAGGESIVKSESEVLLVCLIHKSGSFKHLIKDDKQSILNQIKSRINALKKMASKASFQTRLMVANSLVQSKLAYMLPLYGAAPHFLLNCLQVQQLAAARVVIGYHNYRWSTNQMLDMVGWLSIKQMHAYTVILMTHKVLMTGFPRGIRQFLDTNFTYNTRRAELGQLRFSENIRGRGRTCITSRSFRYQACILYNMLHANIHDHDQLHLRRPSKQWIKSNIPVR